MGGGQHLLATTQGDEMDSADATFSAIQERIVRAAARDDMTMNDARDNHEQTLMLIEQRTKLGAG